MFDKDAGNSLSMITVLNSLDVIPTGPQVEVPHAAIAPIDWVVCTQWTKSDGEADILFDQRVVVLKTDGSEFASTESPFLLTDDAPFSSISLKFLGMPVGVGGRLPISLYLREHTDDDSNDWTLQSEFPLRVRIVPS